MGLVQTSGAIAMRKRRKKLELLGLCTRCGKNEPLEGKKQCAVCGSHKKSHKPKKTKDKIIIRKCKNWGIVNHRLFNKLVEKNLTITELSEVTGITGRQVQRWIFEGVEPYLDNKEKVENILGECWD